MFSAPSGLSVLGHVKGQGISVNFFFKLSFFLWQDKNNLPVLFIIEGIYQKAI